MDNQFMKKICILGLGYIGLPTAAMFAHNGFDVVGVDINPKIIDTFKNGEIHIEEPGLREFVREAVANGKLTVSAQPEKADAFIIAVPTPFNYTDENAPDYKKADMQFVTAAADAIKTHLQCGNLVVLESTSPPRTTIDLVRPILEKTGMKAGRDFHLVYSPERVLPGQILKELVENDRVIGGITPESGQVGRDLYRSFVKGEIVLTDATTAEMVKLMENTYRDVNIAIANEFSRLAERFQVDIWEAISIANRHPRVNILNPGPGVGGHCISVDPWFLVEAAPEITPLILNARQVNDTQPHFVVGLLEQIVGRLSAKRIAVLGLAYKPNVDDIRESPAIEIARLLVEKGAVIRAYEPYKLDFTLPGVIAAHSFEDCVQDADVILLLVPHQQFLTLDAKQVADVTKARIIFDAVNGWHTEGWGKQGFAVFSLSAQKKQGVSQ
jgi:UDP-N-acetyl-D-mannosaminuronic acid dehydrogenase